MDVPETIIKENLSRLAARRLLLWSGTAILQEHGLKVSYAGHPVDADSVDWANANIWHLP
jgi:hypothetical protein